MNKKLLLSKLQIRVEDGLKSDGAVKYANITYPHMAETASDEDVQAVGAAIGSLQTKKVVSVLRVDESALAE